MTGVFGCDEGRKLHWSRSTLDRMQITVRVNAAQPSNHPVLIAPPVRHIIPDVFVHYHQDSDMFVDYHKD